MPMASRRYPDVPASGRRHSGMPLGAYAHFGALQKLAYTSQACRKTRNGFRDRYESRDLQGLVVPCACSAVSLH
jgi:hypothetical protein